MTLPWHVVEQWVVAALGIESVLADLSSRPLSSCSHQAWPQAHHPSVVSELADLQIKHELQRHSMPAIL